jgi:hypothetical protein
MAQALKRTLLMLVFISLTTVESCTVSGNESTSLKSKKDIEAVWAVGILLQIPEVINDLMQCHPPNALGSDGSLIGIDFVSYWQ